MFEILIHDYNKSILYYSSVIVHGKDNIILTITYPLIHRTKVSSGTNKCKSISSWQRKLPHGNENCRMATKTAAWRK